MHYLLLACISSCGVILSFQGLVRKPTVTPKSIWFAVLCLNYGLLLRHLYIGGYAFFELTSFYIFELARWMNT